MTAFAVPLRAPRAHTEHRDATLVADMAAGDQGALAALHARHGARVMGYLRGQLPTEELAEEVAQDVFVAAWRGAAAFRGDSKVLTWLLTIAHHRALNARRRRRHDHVPLEPGRHAHARDADPRRAVDRAADLRDALRWLSPEHRAALELVFFQGLSIAEAADVVDVAPGTIKSRIHRAKAALRRHLDDGDHDDD